jgi:enoyl-CoA hydratase
MAEESEEIIQFKIKRKVGILTLNNGELNVFNKELIHAFRDLIREIKNDDKMNKKVRVLLIQSSSEKAFSAGFDLKAMTGFDKNVINLFMKDGLEFTYDLNTMPQPTISLVNGYSIGIGFLIPVACDFRYATPDAQFQLPEIIYEGMFPTHGGCTRLPKIVNKISDAKYILFTGDRIDAKTAFHMGIVDRIFDTKEDMLKEGYNLAKTMSTKPPLAMQLIKAAVNTCAKSKLEDGLKIEKEAFGVIANTEGDRDELKKKFIQKYLLEKSS